MPNQFLSHSDIAVMVNRVTFVKPLPLYKMLFTRNFKLVARDHKFEYLKTNKVEYFWNIEATSWKSISIFSKTIYCHLNRIYIPAMKKTEVIHPQVVSQINLAANKKNVEKLEKNW